MDKIFSSELAATIQRERSMRLPRFTVRRLMIAVAIIGMTLAVWLKMVTYWDLSKRYQQKVSWYDSMAQSHISRIDSWEILIVGKKKSTNFHNFTLELMEDQIKTDRIWLEYYRGLIAKYQRAARYPWLPVEPDQSDPNGQPTLDIFMDNNDEL